MATGVTFSPLRLTSRTAACGLFSFRKSSAAATDGAALHDLKAGLFQRRYQLHRDQELILDHKDGEVLDG